jgi:hypothetical protein
MNKHILTVFAVTLLAVSSVGQGLSWNQVSTSNSPIALRGHAMNYDSVQGKVVMFGGADNFGGLVSDTWEYDGVNWTQVTTASSPSVRYLHAMIYDTARGKAVMFGGFGWVGSSYSRLNDTWEYDGVNWTQITTASSPSPRQDHAIAYDSARQKVVMFGGYANGYPDETWEYDGVNWTQVTTNTTPSARDQHAMIYDTARGMVVMFGGNNFTPGFLNDTWEYDGVNWTHVATASSPSARSYHSMAYDSVRGKVVMFGGFDSTSGHINDTWEYGGVNWTQVTTNTTPSARKDHTMAYDSVRGKVVMFGGQDSSGFNYLNDTWEFDGGTPVIATATIYGTGCGTPPLDFAPTSNPIVGATAGALISNAPTSFGGVTLGYSDTTFNGLPILPYNLTSLGMPGCHLLQSNEIFGLPVTPVTASTLQFDTAIPYSSALLTQQFYIQAYAFAPGANASQVVTSNGIAWTIGNQ